MKIIIFVITAGFFLSGVVYAADINREALQLAKEYEKDIVAEKQIEKAIAKTGGWKTSVNIKAGIANYEEEEQTVRSDWDAFYGEALCNVIKNSENDIETALGLSYGQAITDTETWHIGGIKYQTNDLDFYRLNIKGSLGKILYSDRYKDLRAIPFLGYGFRLIKFERTNFNILNIITSREVVSEKYYIHHLDCGIKFDNKLSPRWAISGLGAFGYVLYNQADNSALGKINGDGGYLVDGNINLEYSLNDFWKLAFGGSVELQNLKGGEKEDVIWPDNDLNIYAGNLKVSYLF